ncbi:uncharacterized protein LOC143421116 [Maylandia zebra]|uniref:uncharacterized protein LOC143421116 n=1 Tax=Maylandia zebra TaxID=106582 RepID=UPI00403CED2E
MMVLETVTSGNKAGLEAGREASGGNDLGLGAALNGEDVQPKACKVAGKGEVFQAKLGRTAVKWQSLARLTKTQKLDQARQKLKRRLDQAWMKLLLLQAAWMKLLLQVVV